jgi:hypothetical protein
MAPPGIIRATQGMRTLPSIPDPPSWAYGLAIGLGVMVIIVGSEPFSTIETWLIAFLLATLAWRWHRGLS